MMALLYETVSAFEDTWVENNLVALVAIESAISKTNIHNIRDHHEMWTSAVELWYCEATVRDPNEGRLYHHLAILARPRPGTCFSLHARSMGFINRYNRDNGKY